jgi:alanyl-tRNA synthetase
MEFVSMTDVAKLTSKQQLFLDALLSEEAMGDFRIAMRIAGYSDNTKIAHTAKDLRKEIKEATETLLAMYAPKAAYALTSLLDNPDTFNARHIISTSKEILDRTGLGVKSQMEVEVNSHNPIFILPPKQSL